MSYQIGDGTCASPGCFDTAYGGARLCDRCQNRNMPMKRGAVTIREALLTNLSHAGSGDRSVTLARLVANKQSIEWLLEPGSPVVRIELKPADGERSIVEISGLANQKLFDHFDRHPNDLLGMDWRLLEELVAEIFRGFGYDVELTQRTHDGGADVIAIAGEYGISNKYLIECRSPQPGKAIGVSVVRGLYGVKIDSGATKAIAVTTTHFSREAHKFQQRHQWELELKAFEDLKAWIATYLGLKCQ